jgi:hypothetical protein
MAQGNMRNNLKLYTIPNQFINITKTTSVSKRLNNSLIISDKGKNIEGILSDLIIPADPTILAIDWLVTLEKKNQKISPDVAYNI